MPGAHLLDRTSDASHNRSVFTLAGEAAAVADALERLVAVALREIDMEQQSGEHPRIGAVDVVPFVPLGDTTLDDVRRPRPRLRAPDRDALRPARLSLRRGGDAPGPREAGRPAPRPVRGAPGGDRHPRPEPDFGPARTHPRGGATCVGARPFLIAWNINLASDDLELARRIAHRIRESSGGLPAVQAKGFFIEELGCAQVSMNLLDFGRTPLWVAWEAVRAEAAEDGVELAESELIGLAPLAAFQAVADRAGAREDAPPEERVLAAGRFLRLRDASPLMALELRLGAAART